jgi:hypothetical protein
MTLPQAQVCLVTAQLYTLIRSGSKAEIEFDEVSFPHREHCVYQVPTDLLLLPLLISAVSPPVCKQDYIRHSASIQAAPPQLSMFTTNSPFCPNSVRHRPNHSIDATIPAGIHSQLYASAFPGVR